MEWALQVDNEIFLMNQHIKYVGKKGAIMYADDNSHDGESLGLCDK